MLVTPSRVHASDQGAKCFSLDSSVALGMCSYEGGEREGGEREGRGMGEGGEREGRGMGEGGEREGEREGRGRGEGGEREGRGMGEGGEREGEREGRGRGEGGERKEGGKRGTLSHSYNQKCTREQYLGYVRQDGAKVTMLNLKQV